MMNNEVVRLTPLKRLRNVLEPLIAKVGVYRIHDGDFVARNHVGVVGHPERNDILPLEKVHLMVVYTDIGNVGPDFHLQLSLHFAVIIS